MKKSKVNKANSRANTGSEDKTNVTPLVDQKPQPTKIMDPAQVKQVRPASIDAVHRFGKRSGST